MRALQGKWLCNALEKLDPVPRAPRPRKPHVQANLGSDFGNISVEAVQTESTPIGGWLLGWWTSSSFVIIEV